MEIMLDLETASTRTDAAILAIAGRVFWLDQPQPPNFDAAKSGRFKAGVNLMSCLMHGLHYDPGTIEFWKQQPSETWQQFRAPYDLDAAIDAFVGWFESMEKVWGKARIWAKSPSFDCEIMKTAGKRVGVTMPWNFRQERDVRTYLEAAGVNEAAVPSAGKKHVAAADVDHQIECVSIAASRIRSGNEAMKYAAAMSNQKSSQLGAVMADMSSPIAEVERSVAATLHEELEIFRS